MKNTELKNWMTLRHGEQLEKRLVWQAGPEGPKAPEAPKPPKEAIDASNEKNMTGEKTLTELATRIRELNLKPIKIDAQDKVDATKLQNVLQKQLETEKWATKLNIKRIDLYLLDGLMENIKKQVGNRSDFSDTEKKDLSAWMKEKKVSTFSIVDGKWGFKDTAGKDVQDDFKLNGDVSREVNAQKKASEAAKKSGEQVETDRQKPENLEKAKAEPVNLEESKTLDATLGELETNLKNGTDKPAIKAEEMKKMLMEYINPFLKVQKPTLKTDDEKFSYFVKILAESKSALTQISVNEGKIVFMDKNKSKATSNPRNLVDSQKPNGKGGFEEQNIYAHVKLKDKAEAEKKTTEKKEVDKVLVDENDKKDIETKYDATEKTVLELLKKPEGKEPQTVDARYLAAFDAIMNFDETKNHPADFIIPFNDQGLYCTFYKATNGAFILKYGKGEGTYANFTPKADSKTGFADAKKFFADCLNSGETLQKIQSVNVKSKANFETYKVPIDNGPKVLNNGKVDEVVEYELGWKTGAFEKDPHIFIETLPHGEIRVQMKKSDIGFSTEKGANNDELTFVAGGFQDMTRILHSLQQWHENPNKDKPEEKVAEEEKRYFAKGIDGLLADIPADLQAKTGKLLKVDSVGSPNDLKLTQGYNFRFDWMEKMDPAQNMQMVKVGTGFEVTMQPSGKILGHTPLWVPDGFREAMKLVADQREISMTNGGEKMARKKTDKLIADYNDKIGGKDNAVVLSDKVKLVGFSGSEKGQNIVYLSMDGMTGMPFDFSIITKGDKSDSPGIKEAIKQGYLIEGNAVVLEAPQKPADIMTVLTKAMEADKGSPEKSAEGSHIGVLRADVENPSNGAESKIQPVVERIQNAGTRLDVESYLKAYFAGVVHEKLKDNITVGALRNFAKVDIAYLNEKIQKDKRDVGDDQKKIDYLIKVINNPKLKEDKAKDKTPLEQWETVLNKKYEAYPKALNVISANIQILKGANKKLLKDATDNPDAMEKIGGKDFLNDYKFKLEKAVDDERLVLNIADGSTPESVDKDLTAFLSKKLRNAYTECLPEWNKTLDKQKEADAAESKAKAELVEKKKDTNGTPFADFEKQPLKSGLAAEACSILKTSSSIKPDNIFLSKSPGNSLVNNDLVCMNIKAGPDKGQKPYTINFAKRQDGSTVITIAPGWNNTEAGPPNPWVDGKDASKPDKIAYLVDGFEGTKKG